MKTQNRAFRRYLKIEEKLEPHDNFSFFEMEKILLPILTGFANANSQVFFFGSSSNTFFKQVCDPTLGETICPFYSSKNLPKQGNNQFFGKCFFFL
jgi:hypothetical protein